MKNLVGKNHFYTLLHRPSGQHLHQGSLIRGDSRRSKQCFMETFVLISGRNARSVIRVLRVSMNEWVMSSLWQICVIPKRMNDSFLYEWQLQQTTVRDRPKDAPVQRSIILLITARPMDVAVIILHGSRLRASTNALEQRRGVSDKKQTKSSGRLESQRIYTQFDRLYTH